MAIAHGAGANVGEQVNVDDIGPQQESAVPGFLDGLDVLLTNRHEEAFDHLDLLRLGPGRHGHSHDVTA